MYLFGSWVMGPQSVKTSKQTNYNPSYFLRKGLSMNLELAILPRLAGEPLGTIRLCSFPAGTEVTNVNIHVWLLCEVLGT